MLVYGHCLVFFLERFSGEAKITNFGRDRCFCSVLEEHDESSRMPVSTWVCALSFGRCRMSKFWLLVYLAFFENLRPALVIAWRHRTQPPSQAAKPGLASGYGQEAPFDFGRDPCRTNLSYGDTKVLLAGVYVGCAKRARANVTHQEFFTSKVRQ